MLVLVRRFDDQLVSGESVGSLKVLPDKVTDDCAFDVKREGMRAVVNGIPAERRFVATLGVPG
jgi:hypothetical protein